MKSRRNKYGVRTDTIGKLERTADGILFASEKECRRYGELKLLQKVGEITELELQPKFPCVVNGKKVCVYVADFRYSTTQGVVIEDVKGFKTTLYRLKKKLVKALFGIEITET